MSESLPPSQGYPVQPTPGAPVAPPAARGNAMAITGFVIAVVALVLCFVPIINNFAFFLALVGLVFGIIGLVRTRKGASHKGLAIASVVLAVLSGAGVLVSQSFYSNALDSLSDDLEASTGDSDDLVAGDTDAGDAATADEVTREEAPTDAEEGTRANPFAFGQQVSNEDWTVDLGEPTFADDVVKAENPYNEAPADGMEFWMVPVKAVYTGSETGWPAGEVMVEFVGDDAKTYNDSCGVIPDDLMDVDELYEGGEAEGNVCVQVPAGAAGTWTLTAGFLGEKVFFATAD